ncbi:MAG: hypothetical protein PHS93_01020 [Candidatus Omnitrophica bacterium]|nr:hypothetical protein [Candidatus Omnitrophota bacterium]MDD5351734.1 hypothetical protein [Candidatus Omnitrophota bacterium]MDD5550945.1 hypothetical protein [Candidatus Omnitrophota bacterium]
MNKIPKGILLLSTVEIAIGLITFTTLSFSIALNFNTKPLNILIFVYVTSTLSFFLGIGLLRFNRQAYELLMFLAWLVILSKILIFSKIIELNGALETIIPSNYKNFVSIIYHCLLLWYLNLRNVKSLFLKHKGIV